MSPLPGHGRYPYRPIHARPDYSWPEGRRLAVYLGINLEVFAFGQGLGAELAPGGPQPDVLNYAWRDYGNRVGAFRMADLLDELALPASVLVNSAAYAECPGLVETFRARGDEIVGHGRTNAERQGILPEAEERALIAQSTAIITAQEGQPPRGWLGPWISESAVTPDLLKEAGYRYLLDWAHDDQPVWMATRAGPILSVPYAQELNDIPMIVARKLDGAAFATMITDQLDEMLRQSRHQPLVMGIALHPYLMGQPYRLRHLRRALEHILARRDDGIWLTTAGAIASHVEGLPAGTVERPGMTQLVQPATAIPLAQLLALNNAHARETSLLDETQLATMLATAFAAIAIVDRDSLAAFLLTFDQDAPYRSPNFLWFGRRHARFVYVDRIITAAQARGRGHARRLYEDLIARATAAGHARITCEINLVPPNPSSDAFHTALGFVEVDRAVLAGEVKTARYMERSIHAGKPAAPSDC